MRHSIFNRQKGSRQVVRNRARPVSHREFFNWCPDAINARVGEDDIELSPAVNHLLYRSLHLLFLAYICTNGHRLTTPALNLFCRRLYLIRSVTERRDPRTWLCQQHGCRLADSRAGARNQRNFSCQFHCISFPSLPTEKRMQRPSVEEIFPYGP